MALSKRAYDLLKEMHELFNTGDIVLLAVPSYRRNPASGGKLCRALENHGLVETWYINEERDWHPADDGRGRITERGVRFLEVAKEFPDLMAA